MSYLSLSNTSLVAIAISFAVICITIFSLRIVAQIKAKQALKDELAQHDNFAMGISFASEITVVIATMAFLFDEINHHARFCLKIRLIMNDKQSFEHRKSTKTRKSRIRKQKTRQSIILVI